MYLREKYDQCFRMEEVRNNKMNRSQKEYVKLKLEKL